MLKNTNPTREKENLKNITEESKKQVAENLNMKNEVYKMKINRIKETNNKYQQQISVVKSFYTNIFYCYCFQKGIF